MFWSSLLALVLLAAPQAARACGPRLAEALVTAPAEAIWAAPVADFSVEVARLVPAVSPRFVATNASAVDAELAQLVPLGVQEGRWRAWRQGDAVDRPPLPAPVPAEVLLYAEGAVRWHRKDRAGAVAQWKALMRLPPDQRRSRTVWATFMLAEATQEKADFDRVLALVAAGAPDPLGLASATLGEEARLRLWARDWHGAVDGYLAQLGTGAGDAEPSLLMVVSQAFSEGALDAWARDPVLQQVATAWILSQGGLQPGVTDPALIERWLAAIQAAHAGTVAEADHLAWMAYQAGDVASTAAWLDRASPTPLAHWLRAKLLMRAGKLPEAESELTEAARGYPADLLWPEGSVATREACCGAMPAQAAWGEVGVVRLARQDWPGALDAFLGSGSWVDVAYVAERILDVGSVRKAVAALPALPLGKELLDTGVWRGRPEDAVDVAHPDATVSAGDLRYLLGRRLLRAGRLDDLGDFPAGVAADVQRYRDALRRGHGAWTAEGRAEGLWQAAFLMRTRGLSMLGTELEPDYGIYAGEFQDDSDRNTRFAAIGKPLGPTSAEEALWRASAPDPDERYHYRARAADLADQAAGELADDDPRVPILLCRAARWQGDPRISRKYTHEAIMRTGAWPSEPCGDPSFAPLRVLLKRIAAVALGAFLLGILRWRRRPTTERSA